MTEKIMAATSTIDFELAGYTIEQIRDALHDVLSIEPSAVGYVNDMPEAPGEPVIVAITLEPKPDPTAPSTEPIAAGVAVPPAAAG